MSRKLSGSEAFVGLPARGVRAQFYRIVPRHLRDRARETGFEALLVPSAAGPGANLVLFPNCLDPVSFVERLAVEPIEIYASR